MQVIGLYLRYFRFSLYTFIKGERFITFKILYQFLIKVIFNIFICYAEPQNYGF